MLLSKEDTFGYRQTIATSTGTEASTNVIDRRFHGDDIDAVLRWFVQVHNDPASAGAATLEIVWQTSADNSNWTDAFTTGTIAKDVIAAGKFLVDGAFIPRGLKQYNRIAYKTATAAWSSGNAPVLTAAVVRNDMPIA